jgi:pimeloyl-ACP methyl ester carboxylesterase
MVRGALLLIVLAIGLVGYPLGSTSRADEIWQQLPPVKKLPKANKTGYAPVNGINLYYAVYGKGQPLLLLHGGLGTADYWGDQVPVFAKKYQVIIVDSRGHGRSTRDDKPYSYELMASDVLGLLDFLKIQKTALVGWSDGGIIGLDIAINHPERLTKLFAFGANYNLGGVRPDIGKSEVFNRYIAQAGQDYRRLSITPTDYENFLAAVSKMWETEPNYSPDQLRHIEVPTAIADGEHDEAIRREHTEQMAQLIPDAKLIILPNASHFAMWQQPAAFNKAVLDFLAEKP